MHAILRSLYPLRPFISQAALHMVVTAQCLSIINYMCIIWGGASTKVLRTVEKSIRACARFILWTKKYDPVQTQITDTLHWLMPKYLYQHATLCFGHDILFNNCPGYFCNYITFFDTRCDVSRNKYYVKPISAPPKNKYGNRILLNSFSDFWNQLPSEIRALDDRNLFKNYSKNHLLSKQGIR